MRHYRTRSGGIIPSRPVRMLTKQLRTLSTQSPDGMARTASRTAVEGGGLGGRKAVKLYARLDDTGGDRSIRIHGYQGAGKASASGKAHGGMRGIDQFRMLGRDADHLQAVPKSLEGFDVGDVACEGDKHEAIQMHEFATRCEIVSDCTSIVGECPSAAVAPRMELKHMKGIVACQATLT